jgi:hypothetical protein
MTSRFGHGFVTSLVLLAKHLGLPPDKAFFGAAALESFRKAVLWHQPGSMDKEDHTAAVHALHRLAMAIDRELGIRDPDLGEYD